MSSFQSAVGVQPAPFLAGDFVDSNPRVAVLAGPGGLVAGAAGVTVGRFAWLNPLSIDGDGAPAIVNNFGIGAPAGIVPRRQNALITTYLAEASNVIAPGYGLMLFSAGSFAVINDGSGSVSPGMKAYARYADGKVLFAAAGASPYTGSATGSIAASTGSFTGSIAGDVLTITAVGSGVAVVGGTLSGSGVTSGTTIKAQISGTAGGIGTYRVSIQQTVASTTISETYGTFTAASALSGGFEVGDVLSGANVDAGTTITALGTATGGLGTYIVSSNTVVSSTTITGARAYETRWFAVSAGVAGDPIKITTHLLG